MPKRSPLAEKLDEVRENIAAAAAKARRDAKEVTLIAVTKTVTPEISSIRLSPPKASRAKLPAINPTPIDPKTSTAIQPELMYSILIPFPILPCRHD